MLTLSYAAFKDTLKLLRQDSARLLSHTTGGTAVQAPELRALHELYIGLAYDTLSADIVDEDEMRLLAAAIWHPFIIPVQLGEGELRCMKVSHASSLCPDRVCFTLIVQSPRPLYRPC